ncbi:MAG: hypothetical protein V3U02_12575 [Calditrichia bacterium]
MREMLKQGRRPPSIKESRKYDVNVKGQIEAIWQPLYHIQAYPAAGQTQFTFFQQPAGQAALTFRDTNMEAAGMLPAPKEMLVTSIELVLFTGQALSAAAAIDGNLNDIIAVLGSDAANDTGGWLEFFIGSKTYLRDAPLMKFPPSFRLGGYADHGTGAFSSTYSTGAGKLYEITPVKLVANQNFNVTVNFPVATAIVVAGNIGVILNGFQYRLSQ